MKALSLVPWCPQCGFRPRIDEDGCCASCGATCGEVGDWPALHASEAALRAEVERLRDALYKADRNADAGNATLSKAVAEVERLGAARDRALAVLEEWESGEATSFGARVREALKL